MIFNIFLGLLIVGWIIKKIWEARYSEKTGLPPETLWKNLTQADIRRKTVELEREIERIEELVGLNKDPSAVPSILEGLVDWEDFVDPGFDREKEQWFRLNRQLSALANRSRVTPKPTRELSELDKLKLRAGHWLPDGTHYELPVCLDEKEQQEYLRQRAEAQKKLDEYLAAHPSPEMTPKSNPVNN